MKKIIVWLYVLLLFLNIFDVISTYIILQNGGVEANPFMNWLMQKLGFFPAVLGFKGVFLMILWIMCLACIKGIMKKREKNGLLLGLILTNIFYLYIMMTQNLQILIFMKRELLL